MVCTQLLRAMDKGVGDGVRARPLPPPLNAPGSAALVLSPGGGAAGGWGEPGSSVGSPAARAALLDVGSPTATEPIGMCVWGVVDVGVCG